MTEMQLTSLLWCLFFAGCFIGIGLLAIRFQLEDIKREDEEQ